MIEAVELSKYILSICNKKGIYISNLKLQKILYYIQYEVLKLTDKPAFPDNIEAWQFGPVVPSVYYHFCGFGAMNIDIPFSYSEYDSISRLKSKKIIDDVIRIKSKLDPWDMVLATHKENGAWHLTYKSGKGYKDVISIELIKKEIEDDNQINGNDR